MIELDQSRFFYTYLHLDIHCIPSYPTEEFASILL